MWHCGWPAPAKLNRFLHIVGRRDDGYHRLQTLFQFLDFGDSLAFRVRSDSSIRRVTDLPGVSPASDLVVRAAERLQHSAAIRTGVDIHVNKRLPLGGGLGGGSSDAATTLVALNRLWGLNLQAGELAAIGLELGADVPVFIHGVAAWAEGVGEVLTPVEPDEPWYVVIVPDTAVPTAEIFQLPELTRDCPPITIRDFLAGRAVNVCEAPVRRRYPQVAQALDWLTARGVTARLSGTGASVFAVFSDEMQARETVAALPEPRWHGFVARGRNRSPLLDRLQASVSP